MRKGADQRDPESSVNPPHNRPVHEHPEVTKFALYFYHKQAGSMEHFYELYPYMRPPAREERKGGRGR